MSNTLPFDKSFDKSFDNVSNEILERLPLSFREFIKIYKEAKSEIKKEDLEKERNGDGKK